MLGAISDQQVDRVRQLVTGAGQQFTYHLFPDMPHSLHGADPELYTRTLIDWWDQLDDLGHQHATPVDPQSTHS